MGKDMMEMLAMQMWEKEVVVKQRKEEEEVVKQWKDEGKKVEVLAGEDGENQIGLMTHQTL